MPRATFRVVHGASGKSPLRTGIRSSQRGASSGAQPLAAPTDEQLRAMQVSEFCDWLQSRTNHEKRPFHEETITAYAKAARALDTWMTSKAIAGDFTACDTAT
jgi:hypothetical protein